MPRSGQQPPPIDCQMSPGQSDTKVYTKVKQTTHVSDVCLLAKVYHMQNQDFIPVGRNSQILLLESPYLLVGWLACS